MANKALLTIRTTTGARHDLSAEPGSNLREVLLEHGLSPYTSLTRRLNCGGRGLCATCGVWITAGAPTASHWHDRAAQAWGYPRLSCQITITGPMTVQLVDKWIWGPRRKETSR